MDVYFALGGEGEYRSMAIAICFFSSRPAEMGQREMTMVCGGFRSASKSSGTGGRGCEDRADEVRRGEREMSRRKARRMVAVVEVLRRSWCEVRAVYHHCETEAIYKGKSFYV